MEPLIRRGRVLVYGGDCLEVLRAFPAHSVDAVICDPPYGLSELTEKRVSAALRAWLSGDRDHVPDGRGMMGRKWDAFVPPPAVWDECLRVLKPGCPLAAFAGSRTVDLMSVSLRLAGFEPVDTLGWLTGTGFPKSLAVDKALSGKFGDDAALPWLGWGTALKPAIEPVVLVRAPGGTPFTFPTDSPRVFYCSKAPKSERPRYLDSNAEVVQHISVKPLAAMDWLVRALTDPQDVIVDPFAGSGTTLEAGARAGRWTIGMENHRPYLPLIEQRVSRLDEVDA